MPPAPSPRACVLPSWMVESASDADSAYATEKARPLNGPTTCAHRFIRMHAKQLKCALRAFKIA